MSVTSLIIGLAIGVVFGLIIGWLLARKPSGSAPDSRLESDLQQRLAQRTSELKPSGEQLAQFEPYQKNLQQNSVAQSSTLGEVKKQLEMLSQQSNLLANETQQFRQVLHSNQARGRWGEETLRRVVEAAGMSAHCDFSEQDT